MGRPEGFKGCDRCFAMAWEPSHEPAADRNGMRHHPYCLVVGRDALVDAILLAALRLAYAEGIGAHRAGLAEVKLRVRDYMQWRRERGLVRASFEPRPLSREERRREWYESRNLNPDDYE